MSNPQPIQTGKVIDRRVLHFATLDEALADLESLAAADRAGKLRHLGNWTFGQALGHLATWADYSYDGAPMKPPFFVRWMMRPMKKRMLHNPMPAGRHIPRVPGGTLATDLLSSDEGVARITRSFRRLRDEPPTRPHVLFGRMTHDEWKLSHLRHAELHLSFFRPE